MVADRDNAIDPIVFRGGGLEQRIGAEVIAFEQEVGLSVRKADE